MPVPAATAITTQTRLTLPLNGVIYTTRRVVASEKPLPTVGSTMGAELGSAYAGNYVLAANTVPDGSGKTQQIIHASIPTQANQLELNWRKATRNIGGYEFEGIERYFVFLATDYDEDDPAIGDAMPTTASNPFHADPGPSDYVLVDRQLVSSGTELEPVFKVERRFYVDIGADSAQLKHNWRWSSASIGGQRFPSVSRGFIRLASEIKSDGLGTPAPGSAMPVSGDSGANDYIFNGQGYIFVSREITPGPDDLHPHFKLESRAYVKRSTIRSLGIDPVNGKALYRDSSLYYGTEVVTGAVTATNLFADPANAYWGILVSGVQRSGRQLSADWFEIITESLIGGEDGTHTTGPIDVDSYQTSINYYWPPVLATLGFNNWTRQDGSTETYPYFTFEPDAYNGACIAVIERTWSPTAVALTNLNPPRPEAIVYASPGFYLNIPPCLHPAVQAICDYGSGHPIYDVNTGSAETFAATTLHDNSTACTVWPDTIVARDDQQKWRGGYLRTKITVYKPGTVPS